ncbi:hypothetical protein CYG49_00830 [Candidatus Saccharibacteria bacterium]|nr:MAG: hypothetical protein CYG49_00830 [Candidatus Saccharibacteria bacterium]
MKPQRVTCSLLPPTFDLMMVTFPEPLIHLTGIDHVVKRLRQKPNLFTTVEVPELRPRQLEVTLADHEALRRLRQLLPGMLSTHGVMPSGSVLEWHDGACSLIGAMKALPS